MLQILELKAIFRNVLTFSSLHVHYMFHVGATQVHTASTCREESQTQPNLIVRLFNSPNAGCLSTHLCIVFTQ